MLLVIEKGTLGTLVVYYSVIQKWFDLAKSTVVPFKHLERPYDLLSLLSLLGTVPTPTPR